MYENPVNDAARRAADIKSVRSNRKKAENVVVAENLDTARVCEVIRSLGYDVYSYIEKPYQKCSLVGFGK